MKRFIVSVLSVSVFFLGLGSLVEKVSAGLKSDARALELIKAARTAIGGDNAIGGIQSVRIKGNTTHVFKNDGTELTENGETQIAIQLPDKLSKTVKFERHEGDGRGEQIVNKRVETVVLRTDKGENQIVTRGEGNGSGIGTGIGSEPGGRRIIIQKQDRSTEELRRDEGGNVIVKPGDRKIVVNGDETAQLKIERVEKAKLEADHQAMRQNELFRWTLGLLLSPPVAMAVNYTFGGEVTAADRPCNLVVAETGGTSVKLYLDRSSNLPVMMSYIGEAMPMVFHFNKPVEAPTNGGDKDVMFFRKTEGPGATTEYVVRFDDYRSVNGVQLPFKWITTAGDMNEVFNVTDYEVNPADISTSFEQQKVMVRMKKEGQ